jgi:hypothetical protein
MRERKMARAETADVKKKLVAPEHRAKSGALEPQPIKQEPEGKPARPGDWEAVACYNMARQELLSAFEKLNKTFPHVDANEWSNVIDSMELALQRARRHGNILATPINEDE